MRSLILTSAALAAFAGLPNLACATSDNDDYYSDYDRESSYGVTGKTYEVSVDGDRNDTAQDVYDEALHKAARKTLDKGYDWFRVIERDTEKEITRGDNDARFETRYERVPVQSCGLLGCRTVNRTYRRDSFDTGFPERDETRYSVEIEFEVGTGQAPASGDVYDAKMVRRSFR
ncbi:hypothetical protein DES40_2418 [Litorimonas taeanensis]|uniref:Uncharacterized protein n=1 Tax=Litorimonas taeanensis TaxID=568099 RepID=A0A420WF75_9PROT|nr:hypothetical protein [Litorimonas taeanensis]RKQ69615.1 hypothetical protein DES40_2418 [Litorimonas taeanensis]